MNMKTYQKAMAQMEFDADFETRTLTRFYDELKKRRQRRTMIVRGSLGFAACAAAVAATALSVRNTQAPPQPSAVVAPPAASAAVIDSPAAAAYSRRVVVSSEYGGDTADSYALPPEPGQVLLARDVRRALEAPVNADAYFFVHIDIFTPEQHAHPLSEYVYNGRRVAQWRKLVDLANGSYPYSEYNGDHGGNVTKAQWQAAREEARTLDAQQNCDAAVEKYAQEIMPMLTAAKAAHENTELARLQQLGLDVFFMDTWSYVSEAEKQYSRILAGVLSADQLTSVADGSPCGLFIDWVHNGDGIVDWDEALRP